MDAMAISPGTMRLYQGLLTYWIIPWAGSRSLAQVAKDREGATLLVNKTMAGPDSVLLSYNRRGTALGILGAVCNEAVKAERLSNHTLAGIKVADSDVITGRKDFVFPAHKEISLMADDCGIVIWLMRGCGLRVWEALAVSREDFRDGGTTLRVSGQASVRSARPPGDDGSTPWPPRSAHPMAAGQPAGSHPSPVATCQPAKGTSPARSPVMGDRQAGTYGEPGGPLRSGDDRLPSVLILLRLVTLDSAFPGHLDSALPVILP